MKTAAIGAKERKNARMRLLPREPPHRRPIDVTQSGGDDDAKKKKRAFLRLLRRPQHIKSVACCLQPPDCTRAHLWLADARARFSIDVVRVAAAFAFARQVGGDRSARTRARTC